MQRNGAKLYSILLLAFIGLLLGGTTSAYAQAGAVMMWGAWNNSAIPRQVSRVSGIVQVAYSGNGNLFLNWDGTVWVLVDSDVGQVSGLTGVVQVAAGSYHSLALKSDGTVWAWGDPLACSEEYLTDVVTPRIIGHLDPQAYISAGGDDRGTSFSLYPVPTSGNPHNTKISLYSQVAYYGQAITITPKLLATDTGLPILHEPLTISIDGASTGSVMTDAKGNVTFVVPAGVDVGKHTLSVNFTGDSPFYVASDKTTTLSVVKTATFLKMGNVTKRYGQMATFTAVIRRTTDSARLAGKTISLTLDGDSIGQATTDANGAVAFAYLVDEQLQAGAHDIEATFAGDASYKTSVIDVFLSVDPADTRITVNSVAGTYGQTKSLVAILKRNTDNKVVSGRAITFSVDGNNVGTATTDSTGKATLPYLFDEPVTAGAHTLAATFTGDDGYNPSTKSATLTASQAATKISQPSVTGKVGATVQLVAKLKRGTDSKYLNARTIRFFVNGSEVGTAQTDSTGAAAYSYTIPSSLTAGKYTLKVTFDGDSFYLGSAYSGAALTVK